MLCQEHCLSGVGQKEKTYHLLSCVLKRQIVCELYWMTREVTALNDFLALNTKQMNRFHVVMASSGSFFHWWISQYMDSTYL